MSFILTLPFNTFVLNIVDKVEDVKSDVGGGIKLNIVGNKDIVEDVLVPLSKLSLNVVNNNIDEINKKATTNICEINLAITSGDIKDVKSNIVLDIGAITKSKSIYPKKWKSFIETLPVRSDGQIDNKVLKERSKSNLLMICRPDLYESIDMKMHPNIEENKRMTLSSNKKINWICLVEGCGNKFIANACHRNRYGRACCASCSGNKKFSQKQAEDYYLKYGFKLEEPYHHSHYPHKSLCYTCMTIVTKSLSFLNTSGCFNCYGSRKYSQKESEDYYLEYNFKLQEQYQNVDYKHKCLCLTCDVIVTKRLSSLSTSGCLNCAGNKKYSQKEAEDYYLKYNFKLQEQYRNANYAHRALCYICHELTTKCLGSLNVSGCFSCYGSRRYSQKEAEDRYSECNFKLEEQYRNSHHPHKCLCHKCGLIVTKSLNNLGKFGCFNCAALRDGSFGVTNVRIILSDLKIDYKTETRLPILYNRRFDFEFTYNNRFYIVEFDGKQHFKEVSWHDESNPFEKAQETDRLKTYSPLLLGYNVIRLQNDKLETLRANITYCLSQTATKPFVYFDDPTMYKYITDVPLSQESIALVPSEYNIQNMKLSDYILPHKH